jgi:hypothetical protein
MSDENAVTEYKNNDKVVILPLRKAIQVKNVKQAKRLLSRIITQFQRGEITDFDAKTLCYLLISLVSICKDIDFEERITLLEKKTNNNHI